jgi:malonyl-CoA/methylmalonyl-CoA synthetase
VARVEERLAALWRRVPNRIAVDDGQDTLSYADLGRESEALANALAHRGLRPREPIVLAHGNRAHDVAAFLAIWRAGGVAVPLHRRTPPPAAHAVLERLGARLILDVAPEGGAWSGRSTEPVAERGGPPPPARALLDDAATVVFTSGSTGTPKGVVVDAARASAKLDMIQSHLDLPAGCGVLNPLSLGFSFGQWVTWLTLLREGTVFLRASFDAEATLHLLDGGAVSRLALVPTMARRLLQALDGRTLAWPGCLLSGGEPLAAALGERLLEALPEVGVGDIYGLTETGTCDFFVTPEEYAAAAGTLGKPGRGIDYRIRADGGLEIRSPFAMLGYLDAPDLTAQALREGYFRTGDLITRREDGRLVLAGRATDLVNRAGIKVSPLEVESLLLGHPEIHAALVTGIPDQDLGESVHAAVVPRPGRRLAAETIRAWMRERAEPFKVPDRIHVVADLPSGTTGKADRRALRDRVRGDPPTD